MLLLGGCAQTAQERAQEYNEDGVQLYQSGRFVEARECFQAALALDAEDAALLYNLGQCHDRLGNLPRAEQSYNACLQRSPNHANSRHALATLLVRQGRWDEAVQMVQDWLAREPHLASAYAEDGWLWHQAGDLLRAQGRLQQALDLDPRDCRALTELALVYEAMQRPERALVLYERSLEQNPHQPDVKTRMSFLLTNGVNRPRPEE
jgi:tetratricopeptide (TPR) repeat protein